MRSVKTIEDMSPCDLVNERVFVKDRKCLINICDREAIFIDLKEANQRDGIVNEYIITCSDEAKRVPEVLVRFMDAEGMDFGRLVDWVFGGAEQKSFQCRVDVIEHKAGHIFSPFMKFRKLSEQEFYNWTHKRAVRAIMSDQVIALENVNTLELCWGLTEEPDSWCVAGDAELLLVVNESGVYYKFGVKQTN